MNSRKRLSRHFTIEEFDCQDGTRIAKAYYDDVQRLVEWWLEPLRSAFGPVQVVSGFRTLQHNRDVGGAPRSVHLMRTRLGGGDVTTPAGARGELFDVAVAADVVPSIGHPVEWASWARTHRDAHPHLLRMHRGGIGTYVNSGFVHLDTASARSWIG